MRKIFIAQHPTEAHLVTGILETNGISAVVRGELLFTTRGTTPMTPDTLPSVWVADEDVERALQVLAEYRSTAAAPERDLKWVCRNCGERVEPHFEICWNCGASR